MTFTAVPQAGSDGWVERFRLVGGRREAWLERVTDPDVGGVEQYFGTAFGATAFSHALVRSLPTTRAPQRAKSATQPPRFVRVTDNPSHGLIVRLSSGALRTIYGEIQSRHRAIERDRLETGGGLFGLALHGWHKGADVRVASVAVAAHGTNQMAMAYGEIEATEADLAHAHGRHIRRIGDWHVHPGDNTGRPSKVDMTTWLAELDRIDRSRSATRYLGIIATAGPRGWMSRPRLHAWIFQRNNDGRASCHRAILREPARRAV